MFQWSNSSTRSRSYCGMEETHTRGLLHYLSLWSIEVWSSQYCKWHSPLSSTMWPFQYITECWCLATRHCTLHCPCSLWYWIRISQGSAHWCIRICTYPWGRAGSWTQRPSWSGCGCRYTRVCWSWCWQ